MFILCVVLSFSNPNFPEWLTGLILVLGYFPVSIPLNIATAVCFIYLRVAKKEHPAQAWLVTANLCFLPIQLLYYLIVAHT